MRDGVYRVVYDAPRGLDGKRKLKTETVYGNKKQAEAVLNQRIIAIQRGEYVDSGTLTVHDLFERYLRTSKATLAGTTHQRYSGIFKTHVDPTLGRITLGALSPLHLEEAYSKWLQNGRVDEKGGLSAQSVKHHHRFIHRVLNQAVKWKLVFRNVADAVEAPRPTRKEMTVLSETDLLKLLDAALEPSDHALVQNGLSSESAFSAAVTFLAFTGCRRGESLALRWQDVDMKAGTAAIRHSLEQTKNGLALKPPKNGKSRVVQIPQQALRVLKSHKAKQNAYRLQLPEAFKDTDFVFTRKDGSPIIPHSFGDAFRALVKRAGVPKIRLHDLRHGHATLLLKAGVQSKIITERLGHSGTAITLDLYSHLLPGMDSEAAQRFDALLEGARDAESNSALDVC